MVRQFGNGLFGRRPEGQRINIDIFSRGNDAMKAEQDRQDREKAQRRKALLEREEQDRAVKRVKVEPGTDNNNSQSGPSTRYTEPKVISLSSDEEDAYNDGAASSREPEALPEPQDKTPKQLSPPPVATIEKPLQGLPKIRDAKSKAVPAPRSGSGVALTDSGSDDDDWIKELASRNSQHHAKTAAAPEGLPVAPKSPVEKPAIVKPRTGTPEDGPVLTILIHSSIPDTQPIFFKRRLHQTLKTVRENWCEKNNLPPAIRDTAFLTWRRRRVFDSATCHVLGLRVDSAGDIYYAHDKASSRRMGFRNGHLEMQVVTPELFEEMRCTGAGERHSSSTDSPKATGNSSTEPRIKIHLRAQGFPDYKLQVKLSTPMKQIVSCWSARHPTRHSTIFLMFDGEKLGDEMTAQEADFGDKDTVEVHVKPAK